MGKSTKEMTQEIKQKLEQVAETASMGPKHYQPPLVPSPFLASPERSNHGTTAEMMPFG